MVTLEDTIKSALEYLEYENGEDYLDYPDYILTYNPFTEDSGSFSAMIFKETGNLKVYDIQFLVKRNGRKKHDSVLTLTEWMRAAGVFEFYVKFILKTNLVRSSRFDKYKEALRHNLVSKGWGVPWWEAEKFKKLRKLLFDNYILDKDVLAIEEDANTIEIKKTKPKKRKESNSNILLKDGDNLSALHKYIINNYKKERMIPDRSNISNILVGFQDGKYTYPGICFNYPNGFRKIRIINSNIRYLANTDNGSYEKFFEARIKNSKKVYITEGEIDALSLLDICDNDLLAMHNVNSLPSDLSQLSDYDSIIFLVDYDKYEDVKDGILEKITDIFPKKMVEVKYKVKSKDKSVDYNSLLMKGELKELWNSK